MNKMRRYLFVAAMAVFTQVISGLGALVWAQSQPVTFSAMGDMPYSASELTVMQQYMNDHNRYSPSAFLIHVGDILSTGTCSESYYTDMANTLKMLKAPAYIVLGDNEYVDCSNPTQAFGYWKKYFTNFEQNFCGAPFTEHQGVRPENFAFVLNGVLFIGINLVGSCPFDQNEWDTRLQDDVDWINQQFQAKNSLVRAAVIFAQASDKGGCDRSLFFDQFFPAVTAFVKPVLYIHGDLHTYKFDQPWSPTNLKRLEVPKGIAEPPIEVTVTMTTNTVANAFTTKRNPWSSQTIVNMPPCANAGADKSNVSATITLQGSATDDGDPNNSLTTTWSTVSGPGTVTFGNVSSLSSTATFSANGTYVLRLTANDGQLQKTDDVTIGVNTALDNAPIISTFTPTSGAVGAVVTISGSNFTGATSVAFNGTTATSFTVNSSTQITATVPAAATTGKITVANSTGTGISADDFIVAGGGGNGVTFYPTHDSYVWSLSATTNYGTATTMQVEMNSVSDESYPFIKFNVTGITGPVQSAKLRLRCTDGSSDGGSVFLVSNNYQGSSDFWLETGLTWSNAPLITGSALDVAGAVSAGFTIELDVTTAVTGNGIYSFALKSANSNSALYSTKEGANKPELVIEATPASSNAPTITSFTPASGPVSTVVTITGSKFTGATAVAFNGAAAGFMVDSDTQILATVPASATTGKISVTNADGTGQSATDFILQAPPAITSFSPSDGPTATVVTITGSGFTGATTVAFNGTAAGFTLNSDTQIQATVPAGATTGKISVTNAIGTGLSTADFIVTNLPTIASFTPASGPASTIVTITGSKFTGATTVAFNGIAAGFTIDSDTQIQATVPAGATTGKISVTNADGTGSSATDFVVIAPPTIASFTPTLGPEGTEVTINGSFFTGTTGVSFNGNTATTFTVDSDSKIRANVPAGAAIGTGKIIVTNSAGSAMSPADFTITSTPLTLTLNPKYDAYVVSSSPTKNYGTSSTVRARLSSSEINHGYLKFEIMGLSGTLLSAKLRLHVSNASVDGGSVHLASNNYLGSMTPWLENGLIWNNAPGVAGAALSSAGAVSIGQWVEFDVTPAIVGNGTYSFGLKNNNSDAVYYRAKENGTATSPQLVIQSVSSGAPSISSFAPGTGPVETEVTITGNNFSGATTVTFNGLPAASFFIDSNTQIRATVPVGATAGKIVIANAVGSTSFATDFIVTATPEITSFTPANGAAGTEVTITGSHFTGTTSVTFNGNAATSILVDSDSQIRAYLPAGATPGTGKIIVTNSAGSATSAGDFTINLQFTLAPTHDTYVSSSSPSTNYGTASTVRGKISTSEIFYAYLKFDITGLSGTLLSARLRLHVNNASSTGGSIYSVSNDYLGTATPWVESGMNWSNAPSIGGTALSSAGNASVGQWVEFDVTLAIVGDGTYSFGIMNNNSDAVYYYSKESSGTSNDPQLIIQAASGSAAPKRGSATAAETAVLAETIPTELALEQNYPNPFNPSTQIRFSLPQESHVTIKVYSINGVEMRTLVNKDYPAGKYVITFHAKNLPSGTYFYVMQAGAVRKVRQFMLVK